MIETLFFTALLAGIIYVLMPLYQSKSSLSLWVPEDAHFSYLQEKRVSLYTHLKDLDFDFSIGKIAEDDYQRIRTELKEEAAQILSQIDQLEVLIGKELVGRSPKECAHCQKLLPQNAKFCPECGGKIP